MSPRALVVAVLLLPTLSALPAHAAAKVDCAKVKCLALTFDDGPGPSTGALLSTLKKSGAKATFFLMGKHVEQRPTLVKRMAAEGHEIGNHTWSHPSLPTLFDEEITRELRATQEAIEGLIGRAPRMFRPPYGHTDDRVAGLAGEEGMAQVLWTGTTLDWKLRDQKKIRAAVLRLAKRDGVILMHDVVPQTVQVMPALVKDLRKRGYHLVTVSTLLRGRKLTPGETYPI
ncbi:polysaccharide deacetylase family protein [Nonomuraea sp. NPDC059194]|uniref:polysaccharide deacetylase family protein n=1 Tax=Nonomuraea sp. NPDC059194 TaxID=3346764 RepID=UPI003683D815